MCRMEGGACLLNPSIRGGYVGESGMKMVGKHCFIMRMVCITVEKFCSVLKKQIVTQAMCDDTTVCHH